MAAATATALADQTVVSATVYPGTQGNISTPSVGLAGLHNCPSYTGPSPMYLYPSQQPWVAPTGSTWTLSTVLQCGLGIPASDISSVQVATLHQGYEAPLSADDLTDTGQYHDPQAPGALPVIAGDGSEDQNTYFRPWRGGNDQNARDQVVQSDAPVSVVVYANGALLTVTGASHPVSHTATTATMGLSATVHAANGATIPASSLSWSWDFGDGGTSASAAPVHRFTDGVYYATVQVTDTQNGSGGTATIRVTTPAAGASGSANRPGAGRRTGSHSPAGTDTGHHRTPATTSAHAHHATPAQTPASSPAPTQPSSPASGTPTPTATPTTAAAPTATPHPAATRPHRSRARARRRRIAAAVIPGARVISGQVLSGITPVSAATSPLVRTTSPAQSSVVRSATDGSMSLAGPGAAAAVFGLLGLGAGRELRGRRRWRMPREHR